MFTAQNTGFPGRSSVWLKFTPSEDKPHAPMVVLSVIPAKAGMTGFCEACLRLDREEERAFVYATIGLSRAMQSNNRYMTAIRGSLWFVLTDSMVSTVVCDDSDT